MVPCGDYAQSNTKQTDEALTLLFLVASGMPGCGYARGQRPIDWVDQQWRFREKP